jgi:hypothetical protein
MLPIYLHWSYLYHVCSYVILLLELWRIFLALHVLFWPLAFGVELVLRLSTSSVLSVTTLLDIVA